MRLFLSIMITLLCSHMSGQLPDTLRVNAQSTVSLAFPGPVMVVDIGNQGYIHQKQEEVLLLKSTSSRVQPTSFFVKYQEGEETHYLSSTIAYGRPQKTFFNIQQEKETFNELPAAAIASKEENGPSPYFPTLVNFSAATSTLQGSPRQFFSIGHKKGKYTAYIHSLHSDEQAIYIRLALNNRGRLPYALGNIQVEHVGTELVNRTFNSRKQKLDLLDLDMPGEVAAKTTGDLFIAIPADIIPYTNKNSSLIIKILPSSGIGGFKLQLPGKFFMNLNNI